MKEPMNRTELTKPTTEPTNPMDPTQANPQAKHGFQIYYIVSGNCWFMRDLWVWYERMQQGLRPCRIATKREVKEQRMRGQDKRSRRQATVKNMWSLERQIWAFDELGEGRKNAMG